MTWHGLSEQIAEQPQPAKRRASATQPWPAPRHHTGHHPGLHPDDAPATTSPLPYRTPTRGEAGYDVGEEREYEEPPRPRSTAIVRRRPVTEMALARHPKAGQTRRGCLGWHPLLSLGLSMALCAAFVALFLYVPPAWQRHLDDVTYGYPRTYQTDAAVGHGDRTHPVSHFLALNLQGVIEVMEIPGDPERHQPYLYLIVRLALDGADLVPVTVSFRDMNGDGKLDLLVFVNGTFWVWFNTGTRFVPHL
jgi:hypothetical protein